MQKAGRLKKEERVCDREMANPRRNSNSNSYSSYQIEQNSSSTSILSKTIISTSSTSVLIFLKKPHAIPILLCIFVLLTWISIRLQHSYSSQSQSQSDHLHHHQQSQQSQQLDDLKANVMRFSSSFPSQISKDKRGWLLNPLSLALDARLKGGAVSCASVHLGQITPGALRGNHRHYTCNETFLIWGALTKFRLENSDVADKGYAEVILGPDEVSVAASPSGTAHALLNLDPIRISYFISCQDSIIDYNTSTTDFNVWKDL